MTIKNNTITLDENKYEIAKLNYEQLQKIKFDSSDDDLNDFLYNESLNYCKENLAIVYLVYQENTLLGYFSLSSDSIKLNQKLDIKLKYYPSIKIGRLAIDKKYQKEGIGSWIIKWIKGYALTIRIGHGIRYLSVDAYNKKRVIKFYENNHFTIYKKEKNKNNIPMYIDLNKTKN